MATQILNKTSGLDADVTSDVYNVPVGAGRYAFTVQAIGDGAAACDVALFMQTTYDGGTNWIDIPWSVHLITADSTTAGTLTTTPARNIFKYTTEPAAAPGQQIIVLYDLPQTQWRFKYKRTSGDIVSLTVWLLHHTIGPA